MLVAGCDAYDFVDGHVAGTFGHPSEIVWVSGGIGVVGSSNEHSQWFGQLDKYPFVFGDTAQHRTDALSKKHVPW